MLFAGSLAILGEEFRGPERGGALGIWGAMVEIGCPRMLTRTEQISSPGDRGCSPAAICEVLSVTRGEKSGLKQMFSTCRRGRRRGTAPGDDRPGCATLGPVA